MNATTRYQCNRCRTIADIRLHGRGPVCCGCRKDMAAREARRLAEGWETVAQVTAVVCTLLGAVGVISAVLAQG